MTIPSTKFIITHFDAIAFKIIPIQHVPNPKYLTFTPYDPNTHTKVPKNIITKITSLLPDDSKQIFLATHNLLADFFHNTPYNPMDYEFAQLLPTHPTLQNIFTSPTLESVNLLLSLLHYIFVTTPGYITFLTIDGAFRQGDFYGRVLLDYNSPHASHINPVKGINHMQTVKISNSCITDKRLYSEYQKLVTVCKSPGLDELYESSQFHINNLIRHEFYSTAYEQCLKVEVTDPYVTKIKLGPETRNLIKAFVGKYFDDLDCSDIVISGPILSAVLFNNNLSYNQKLDRINTLYAPMFCTKKTEDMMMFSPGPKLKIGIIPGVNVLKKICEICDVISKHAYGLVLRLFTNDRCDTCSKIGHINIDCMENQEKMLERVLFELDRKLCDKCKHSNNYKLNSKDKYRCFIKAEILFESRDNVEFRRIEITEMTSLYEMFFNGIGMERGFYTKLWGEGEIYITESAKKCFETKKINELLIVNDYEKIYDEILEYYWYGYKLCEGEFLEGFKENLIELLGGKLKIEEGREGGEIIEIGGIGRKVTKIGKMDRFNYMIPCNGLDDKGVHKLVDVEICKKVMKEMGMSGEWKVRI